MSENDSKKYKKKIKIHSDPWKSCDNYEFMLKTGLTLKS